MLEWAWTLDLLGGWHIVHLHVVELASHHLLSLHICKLLLHHCHLVRILHLCWVLVALGSLSSASVAHNHTFHHIGERVSAEPSGLLAIRLTRSSSHCFVEHCELMCGQILFIKLFYFRHVTQISKIKLGVLGFWGFGVLGLGFRV